MISAQALPVRVYQTADRIMLAAPMPELEPGDISVLIAKGRLQGIGHGVESEGKFFCGAHCARAAGVEEL
jgi:HSP20 family molecular chaperone IbpA